MLARNPGGRRDVRRRPGIEFALDVSPADRKPMLVTARAQKRGAIAHDDFAVVAASAPAT